MTTISQYQGADVPPPLHWKACHRSAVHVFKAWMTCSRGHAMVLSGHKIAADGSARPSVVCPTPGCDFHEYVRLDGWDFGEVA